MDQIPLNLESLTVVYGPLILFCIALMYAVAYQWKELQKARETERKLLQECNEQNVTLLQSFVEHEKEMTAQFIMLSESIKNALDKLSQQIEKVAK